MLPSSVGVKSAEQEKIVLRVARLIFNLEDGGDTVVL
jgi:hypothetical protein